MATDEISTDPRMQQEARDAAKGLKEAEALPKLPYDPKTIAREVYEQVIDRRIVSETFDQIWTKISDFSNTIGATEVISPFTESELRTVLAGFMHTVNEYEYTRRVQEESNNAQAMRSAAQVQIRVRLKWGNEPHTSAPDMARGMLRQVPEGIQEKPKCIMHPNGCPEGGIEIPVRMDAQGFAGFLDLIRNLSKKDK